MTKIVVCALDIATTTGWALHKPGMERPFWGSARLPGGPYEVGRPADALERMLRDIHIMHGGVTHWFFEAQHVAGKINIDTVYRLIALGGVVEKFAFQTKAVGAYKQHISEWRKHFIGRGGGFKRNPVTKKYLPGEDPKEIAIRKCAQYGWHTDISDEAEALGILDYSLSMIPDYERPWRDRALFAGRD